jgi:hypothetical protein
MTDPKKMIEQLEDPALRKPLVDALAQNLREQAGLPPMIYVVYGRTGEYSDRTEWPVRAFFTEQAAKDFRQRLLDAVRELGCGRNAPEASSFPVYYDSEIETEAEYAHLREPWRRVKALDPDFKVDYTGTDYSYHGVPLGFSP